MRHSLEMSAQMELPSGTVTLLFSDIEGSTRLVRRLRDRYGEVLLEHRRLLRAAFEAHRGHELGTQGDSFFVAFGRANDAVAAAVVGQRALSDHDWPEGADVKVRIGIHTGEPALGDEGYHGLGLHRAARICGAGHGGQILVSNATRELIEDELSETVELLDLGENRLKDLDRPERIFQVRYPGVALSFPPLRTLDAPGGAPPQPLSASASVAHRPRGGHAGADASAAGALVGRRHEMNVLVSGLEKALGGRGSLFLVAGEAGIGKSRLLDELAREARERGAQVLWGRCWEAGGAPAYWPWIQSLRAYVRATDRDALREQVGGGAADVAQMLPELSELLPDLPEPPSLDPETARFRLFESLASFLVEAAKTRPLLLVLDDLHAADEPSLRLLQFVAGQLAAAPLLIAGAYRDVELEPDSPLASVVVELARERATHRLGLAGLSEPEVGRLIESSARVRPPRRSVAAIHHGTEGNPLFVGEVVRLLSSEGRLTDVSGAAHEALPIPAGVREVIGRRLRHLSEDCRGILTLAAVLGREFDFGALAHVSGRSEEELLNALDEAFWAHVLSEVPAAPARLRFAHALIRDTLYGELGGPRRLRLHREVGEALEALYADDRTPHLAELAYHYLVAAHSGDTTKAVEYARAAGDRAVALFAYEEAIRVYGMALDALGPDGTPTDRVRCELLLALADAEGRAGDGPEAKATFLRAAEIARSAGLPELLARAAVDYGGRFVWARAASDERLVPLLEDALSAVGERDSVLRVQLLSRLAAALRGEPSRERRERLGEEAVRAARRIGDPAMLAYALDAAESALFGPHTVKRRLEEAEEIVSLARRIGDSERLFDGHEHAFWAAWELGDPARRAAEMADLTRVAEELRQPAQLWSAAEAQAALALAEGRFAEAEGLIERAATVGERALSWNVAATRRLQLFVLRREQGRLEGFEREVRESAHEFPSPLLHRAVLAYVCARVGHTAEAEATLHELTSHDLSDWHVDEEWLLSICLLAEACAILGDTERAGPLRLAQCHRCARGPARLHQPVAGDPRDAAGPLR
jgi:class 3 adenylate cyclase